MEELQKDYRDDEEALRFATSVVDAEENCPLKL
jgi:hypothetical protein